MLTAQGEVVASFDINSHANLTYEANFGLKPIEKMIEHIPMADLAKYRATCWLLSPPCQPYTQGGSRKDDKDERARGLLYLFEQFHTLPEDRRPVFLLLENVPNFEISNSRRLVIDTLRREGYVCTEFLLTPTQFGFPYHRRRYFLTAYKQTHHFGHDADEDRDGSHEAPGDQKIFTRPFWLNAPESSPPLSTFLDTFASQEEEDRYLVPKEFILNRKAFRFGESFFFLFFCLFVVFQRLFFVFVFWQNRYCPAH